MRKTRRIRVLSFLTLLLLAARAESAQAPEAGVVRKIETAYEKLQDIEATFTQKIVFKDFATPFTSKGKVFLKHGKMRWDYSEPTRQQIFVNGDRVLYYVPEHQQAITSTLAAETDSHVPIHLLSGTTRLSQDFDITLAGKGEKKNASRLDLIPKDANLKATKIQIEVSPPAYLIEKITLIESNGNRSVFDFSDLRVDRGLDDSVFSFKVPKGVEVVEQPPIQ